jgi:hypothetical protein
MTNPSDRASHSMSVFQHNTGARTRNVVNVADPGASGTVAFTLSSVTANTGGVPDALLNAAGASRKTEGFHNFRRQRYLHLLAINNNSGDAVKLKIWLYNSAFEQWGCLNEVYATGDAATISHADVELSIADDQQDYFIFDIKGAERVFIQCTDAAGSNDLSVFLGVNSF